MSGYCWYPGASCSLYSREQEPQSAPPAPGTKLYYQSKRDKNGKRLRNQLCRKLQQKKNAKRRYREKRRERRRQERARAQPTNNAPIDPLSFIREAVRERFRNLLGVVDMEGMFWKDEKGTLIERIREIGFTTFDGSQQKNFHVKIPDIPYHNKKAMWQIRFVTRKIHGLHPRVDPRATQIAHDQVNSKLMWLWENYKTKDRTVIGFKGGFDGRVMIAAGIPAENVMDISLERFVSQDGIAYQCPKYPESDNEEWSRLSCGFHVDSEKGHCPVSETYFFTSFIRGIVPPTPCQ
jgi:hypothetical protein